MESLAPATKRVIHERFTLVAGVLPFLTDEKMRILIGASLPRRMRICKMSTSSTTSVQRLLWAIKTQFSTRPNWASCRYSLFSVHFYLTSATQNYTPAGFDAPGGV